VALIAVNLTGRRALAWARSLEQANEERRQQLVTVIHVVRWTLAVILVTSAVLMLMGAFGLNITPVLASVGVAGLAVSLGAQTLIKDLIGGVLIVIENQFSVGDFVTVGDASGEVERITLRMTQLRAATGDLFIVPNGEVRTLANHTKDWSRAVVDVGVAYEEDLDRALAVLQASAEAVAQDPAFEDSLLEPPRVMGPMGLGAASVILRVDAKTEPGKHWEMGRELRRRILADFERDGVSLPYPRQEVWVRGLERDGAAGSGV
jgi:small conductance mechanosensitive channel